MQRQRSCACSYGRYDQTVVSRLSFLSSFVVRVGTSDHKGPHHSQPSPSPLHGIRSSSIDILNRPASRYLQDDAGNIIGEGGSQEEHRTRRLFRCARTTQWNKHWGHLAHLVRYTEGNLFTVAYYLLGALFGCRQARLDEAVADTIDLDIVAAPFLRQRLRQAGNTRFRCRVVCLSGVAIDAGDRGNVDHLARIGAAMSGLFFPGSITDEV